MAGLVRDPESIVFQGRLRNLTELCPGLARPSESQIQHPDEAILAVLQPDPAAGGGGKSPLKLQRQYPDRKWAHVPWNGVVDYLDTPDGLPIRGTWGEFPEFYARVLTLGAKAVKEKAEALSLHSASTYDLSRGGTPDDDDPYGDQTPPPKRSRVVSRPPPSIGSDSSKPASQPSRYSPPRPEGQQRQGAQGYSPGQPPPHRNLVYSPLRATPVGTPAVPPAPRFSPGGSFPVSPEPAAPLTLTEGRGIRKALKQIEDDLKDCIYPFDGRKFDEVSIQKQPLTRYFQLWIQTVLRKMPHLSSLDSRSLSMALFLGLPPDLRMVLQNLLPPQGDTQSLVSIMEREFPQTSYDPHQLPPATQQVQTLVTAMMLHLAPGSTTKRPVTTEEVGNLVRALDAEEHQALLILTVYPTGRHSDRRLARTALENLFLLKDGWRKETIHYLRDLRQTNDNVVIPPHAESRRTDYPASTDEEFVAAAILTLRSWWAQKQRAEHQVRAFLGADQVKTRDKTSAPKAPVRKVAVNLVQGDETEQTDAEPADSNLGGLGEALSVLTVASREVASTVKSLQEQMASLSAGASTNATVNAVGRKSEPYDAKKRWAARDDRTPESKQRAATLLKGMGRQEAGLCFRYAQDGVCNNTTHNGGCTHPHVCHEGYLHQKEGSKTLVGCGHLSLPSFIMAKRRAALIAFKKKYRNQPPPGGMVPEWPTVNLSAEPIPLPPWKGTSILGLDEKADEVEHKALQARDLAPASPTGTTSVNLVHLSVEPPERSGSLPSAQRRRRSVAVKAPRKPRPSIPLRPRRTLHCQPEIEEIYSDDEERKHDTATTLAETSPSSLDDEPDLSRSPPTPQAPDAPPLVTPAPETVYSLTRVLKGEVTTILDSCRGVVLNFLDKVLPTDYGFGKSAPVTTQELNLEHYAQGVSRLLEMGYWDTPSPEEQVSARPQESDVVEDPECKEYAPDMGPDEGAPVPVNLVGDGPNFKCLGTIRMDNQTSLPYIMVEICGVKTTAMLDSGSCASFLTSHFADRLLQARPDFEALYYQVASSTVTTFGSGSKTTPITRAMPLPITVGSASQRQTGTHTMYVAPNSEKALPWGILLGIDVMTKWMATLSMECKRVDFKQVGPQKAAAHSPIYTREEALVLQATSLSLSDVASVNFVQIPPRQSALLEVAPTQFKYLRTEAVLNALASLDLAAHMMIEPTTVNPLAQSKSPSPERHDPAALLSFPRHHVPLGSLRLGADGLEKGRLYRTGEENDLQTWTIEVNNFSDETVSLEPGKVIGHATLGHLPALQLDLQASGESQDATASLDPGPPSPDSTPLPALYHIDTLALLIMLYSVTWTVVQSIFPDAVDFLALGAIVLAVSWTVVRRWPLAPRDDPGDSRTRARQASGLREDPHVTNQLHLSLRALVWTSVPPEFKRGVGIAVQKTRSRLPSSSWWCGHVVALCWGALLHGCSVAREEHSSLSWSSAERWWISLSRWNTPTTLTWWTSLTPQAQLLGPACCWAAATGLYYCLLLWCTYGATIIINRSRSYRTVTGRVPRWILPYLNPLADATATPGHAVAGGIAWLLVLGLSMVTAEIFYNPMVAPALIMVALFLVTAACSFAAFKVIGKAVASTLSRVRTATAAAPAPLKLITLGCLTALVLHLLGAVPVVTVAAELVLARAGLQAYPNGGGGDASQLKSNRVGKNFENFNFEHSDEFYNVFPGVFSVAPPDDRDPWERALERFQRPTAWSDKDMEYLKSIDWYQVLEKTDTVTREQFVKAGNLLLKYAELGEPVDFVEGPSPHMPRRQ